MLLLFIIIIIIIIIVTMVLFPLSTLSADELKTIYSTLLNTHFFTPENATSSSSAAQQFGLHDDRSQGGNVRFLEESLRTVMTSMVKVTVELSERMRSMFLPTAQRCHYFFTTRDLSTIFR